jgi:hypothetical protein
VVKSVNSFEKSIPANSFIDRQPDHHDFSPDVGQPNRPPLTRVIGRARPACPKQVEVTRVDNQGPDGLAPIYIRFKPDLGFIHEELPVSDLDSIPWQSNHPLNRIASLSVSPAGHNDISSLRDLAGQDDFGARNQKAVGQLIGKNVISREEFRGEGSGRDPVC